ncbi:MAG: biotin/lipoyl-binding protein [Verrucomicrobia bacterium]|nr:biotin/lipoyl-binding protein [Verrucomicrobiota bacterium]
MKLDPLPVIPSPPEHHWRQFRVKVVPYLTFGIVLILTIWLWGRNLANPLLQGTAEGLETDVASPKSGKITKLNVVLYQEVKAGDVIAIVDPGNAAVLSNHLALAGAEIEQARVDSGLRIADKVRYAQFQNSWMRQQADLLAARSQLFYASNEFLRVSNLFVTQTVSQIQYDWALRDYKQADELVKGYTTALAVTEKTLTQLDPAQPESPSLKSALAVAEAKFQLTAAEFQPIILTAPISGRVTKISALAGANVAAAAPIVSIADSEVKRIIGFIGLPLRIEPKVGMEVEIRSRGLSRVVGHSRITYVGPRIEIFNAPMRLRSMESAQERGLPIALPPPPNMHLLPGELVDLNLLLDARNSSPARIQ